MKTVKIPDLSQVELNVPFVHFHKKADDKEPFCYIELFINVPLGTKCSAPKIDNIEASKTVGVTFELTHPAKVKSEEFELIHIPRFKVKIIFPPNEAVISVHTHKIVDPHKLMPEADGAVTVRYKDVTL